MSTYVFTPTLDLHDGYSVADDVELPQIKVEIIVLMGFAATATEVNVGDFDILQTQIADYASANDDIVITVTAA